MTILTNPFLLVVITSHMVVAANLFSPRIIGGIPVTSNELRDRFAYMASLRWGGHRCGGTLIAGDLVLTAAHCVYQSLDNQDLDVSFDPSWFDPSQILYDKYIPAIHTVQLGQVDLRPDSTLFSTKYAETFVVEKSIVHPYFNLQQSGEQPPHPDIAILKLYSASKYVQQFARLDNPQLTTDWTMQESQLESSTQTVQFTTMGYGVDESQLTSEILKQTTLEYVPHETCKMTGLWDFLQDDMMCATGGGERDSCNGDSGGPLFWETNENGQVNNLQVGIVSWGVGCNDPIYPGVYTKISSHYGWIRTQVCKQSRSPPSIYNCPRRSAPTNNLPLSNTDLIIDFELPLFVESYGLVVESLDDIDAEPLLDVPPGTWADPETNSGYPSFSLKVQLGRRYRVVLLNTSGRSFLDGRIIVKWGSEVLVDEKTSQGDLLVFAIERSFRIADTEGGTSTVGAVEDLTDSPSKRPTNTPSIRTLQPTPYPTNEPTMFPTRSPTEHPTEAPTKKPSIIFGGSDYDNLFKADVITTEAPTPAVPSRSYITLGAGFHTIDPNYVMSNLGYRNATIPVEVYVTSNSFALVSDGVTIAPEKGSALSLNGASYVLVNGGLLWGCSSGPWRSPGDGIYVQGTGKIDIMGGVSKGGSSGNQGESAGAALHASDETTVTIRGGTFAGGVNSISAVDDGPSLEIMGNSVVNVYGGSFDGVWKLQDTSAIVVHACNFTLGVDLVEAKLLDGSLLVVPFISEDDSSITAETYDEEDCVSSAPTNRPTSNLSFNPTTRNPAISLTTYIPTSRPTLATSRRPSRAPVAPINSDPVNSPDGSMFPQTPTSRPTRASSPSLLTSTPPGAFNQDESTANVDDDFQSPATSPGPSSPTSQKTSPFPSTNLGSPSTHSEIQNTSLPTSTPSIFGSSQGGSPASVNASGPSPSDTSQSSFSSLSPSVHIPSRPPNTPPQSTNSDSNTVGSNEGGVSTGLATSDDFPTRPSPPQIAPTFLQPSIPDERPSNSIPSGSTNEQLPTFTSEMDERCLASDNYSLCFDSESLIINQTYAETILDFVDGYITSQVQIRNGSDVYIDTVVAPNRALNAVEVTGKSHLETGSDAEITGGLRSNGLVFRGASTGNLMNGTRITGGEQSGTAVLIQDGSFVNVTGGSYQGGLYDNLSSPSVFNPYGRSLSVRGSSQVDIYGGSFLGDWLIGDGAKIIVHGCDFSFDGENLQGFLRDNSLLDVTVIAIGLLSFEDECPDVVGGLEEEGGVWTSDAASDLSPSPTPLFDVSNSNMSLQFPQDAPWANSTADFRRDYTDTLGPITISNIQMTLALDGDMQEGTTFYVDRAFFAMTTSFYINQFYSEIGKEAYDVKSEIQVTNVMSDVQALRVEITYEQTTMYRSLVSSNTTVEDVIRGPFLDEYDRIFFTILLKRNMPGFATISYVTIPEIIIEANSTSPITAEVKSEDRTTSKVIWSLVGVFLTVIICCSGFGIIFWRKIVVEPKRLQDELLDEEAEFDDELNPESEPNVDIEERSTFREKHLSEVQLSESSSIVVGNSSQRIQLLRNFNNAEALEQCVGSRSDELGRQADLKDEQNDVIIQEEALPSDKSEHGELNRQTIQAGVGNDQINLSFAAQSHLFLTDGNNHIESMSLVTKDPLLLTAGNDEHEPLPITAETGIPLALLNAPHDDEDSVTSRITSQTTGSSLSLGNDVIDLEIPPGALKLTLDYTDAVWPVIRTVPESSIATGFISPGDRLVSVEARDVRTVTQADMAKIMNEPCDRSRRLTIFRGNGPFQRAKSIRSESMINKYMGGT